MPVIPGMRLGPYEITGPLGKGGMGEVYRARDTTLDRAVAIKVLPAELTSDPERLARFEREARVLASLNHPNIAQIYGIEESCGVRALVMELVPGEPVRGPLPVETALAYAKQIAAALEAAHEKGVVHRDLKPANILATPDGDVKVLDFGLALVQDSEATAADAANSPTRTSPLTQAGMIMGTAAYMSPEQARGKTVDKRADIWAFGAVLYELLTGTALFQGETAADILVNVLGKEPDVSKLPVEARFVVARCLRHDPRKRWQAAGDLRIALDEGVSASGITSVHAAPVKRRLGWIAATVLLTSAASFVGGRATHTAARTSGSPLLRLELFLDDFAASETVYAANPAAISADGTRIAYTARGPGGRRMLAARMLDRAQASVISGTENGVDPFFSPDGQWIGFFADNKLKKVSLNGGPPIVLAAAANPRGGSWGDDGSIVAALTNTAGLSRIPAGGGAPEALTRLQADETTHRWPQILPGSDVVLFTSSGNISGYDTASIERLSMRTGERTTLQREGYFGRYVSSGHLLYVHNGTLFGVALDAALRKASGYPAPLLLDVASDPTSGAGQFDVSATGVFVYSAGKAAPPVWPVNLMGADGKTQLLLKPAAYFTPRFSPDGRRLAVGVEAGHGLDLYLYDRQRDFLSRLTITGLVNSLPVWTPDGAHIAFLSYAPRGNSILWIRADGAGGPQRLLESKRLLQPGSFSPDGRRLAYQEQNDAGNFDLFTIAIDLGDPDHPKPGKPEPFLHTQANEASAVFSPDGRWIAYTSDEVGSSEVYVRPFPGSAGGSRWQISSGGGRHPIWARDGKNLFYESSAHRIMVSSYVAGPASFSAGKPRQWSDAEVFNPLVERGHDLAPDGTRFALLGAPMARDTAGGVRVTFVLNLQDELRRRLSVGGR